MVMVGAANSDLTRISFFGSTKGELAQKLDRGQDAVGRQRLTQVPPEPREMVTQIIATLERSPAQAEANPDHERKERFRTRQPACIPRQGGKKKSHHFFSTVLGSTDGDSKYEGPPNSTSSLTSAFKSRKPKWKHQSLQL